MGCMSAGLRNFSPVRKVGGTTENLFLCLRPNLRWGGDFFMQKNFVPRREAKTEHRFL